MFQMLDYKIEMAVRIQKFSAARIGTLTYYVHANNSYHGLCFPTVHSITLGPKLPNCCICPKKKKKKKEGLDVTSSAIVVLTAFLDSPNLPKGGLSGFKGKFSWRDT